LRRRPEEVIKREMGYLSPKNVKVRNERKLDINLEFTQASRARQYEPKHDFKVAGSSNNGVIGIINETYSSTDVYTVHETPDSTDLKFMRTLEGEPRVLLIHEDRLICDNKFYHLKDEY
jgi:hypothetical protein